MRVLLALSLFLAAGLYCPAQSPHFSSLRFSGHFDFGMRVPSPDDAGFGLQLDAALFARQKLRPVISAHIEKLLGSKLYIAPDEGRLNKQGTIYGIQAGPEYFIHPAVALSLQYGVYWHAVQAVRFTADDGYRFALTLLPEKGRRLVIHLSRSEILTSAADMRYHTFGLGYRFF